MRAMILAAGLGTRMRPLTDHCPKPLLRAGGETLIGHLLQALARGGYAEVIINHAWKGEMIEAALGQGADYGIRIHYSAEGTPLETAGGIRRALDWLDEGENQPFLVVNGDIWIDYPFQQLMPVASTLAQDVAHLVLTDNPTHHPAGDFALDAQGRLHLDRQPRLTFTGVGLYRPSLFRGLPDGARPLAPLLRQAIAENRVRGEHYRGVWSDIGTPERLEALDQQLRQPHLG